MDYSFMIKNRDCFFSGKIIGYKFVMKNKVYSVVMEITSFVIKITD